MRSLRLFCGIIALSAACSLAAHADPISFTETVTGSGSLGGVSFSNQLITLSGSSDTIGITYPFSNVPELTVSNATVQIGANAPVAFSQTILAFANSTLDYAGFANASQQVMLAANSSAFAGYNFGSSVTGSGSAGFNAGLNFSTASGSFDITATSGNSTFTANLGPTSTPEPSSLLLLGTGLAGAAAAARRKLSVR